MMSDPFDASTPSADEVEPDPGNPVDPAELQSAADLDQDELGIDPLEEGMEPPDQWSTTVRDRPTPREQRAGGTVEERLFEERADSSGERANADKPLRESRLHEMDETVDERANAEVADGAVSEGPEKDWGSRGGAGEGVLREGPGQEPVESSPGAVMEGEQPEATGLAAATNEGTTGEPVTGVSPEEGAERIEDSGG